MSQLADNQRTLPSPILSVIAPVQQELARAEELLQRELRSDAPFVDELLQYGSQLGGKRLRPALLLLTAQATGSVGPAHELLAAVIEMIHTATLVHDDVLDEAETRRHLATINSRWNNEASVLLGDYLFSHAFYLASTLDSTYACQRIGQSTNRVCAGELRQVGHRGNLDLNEEEYYRIIDGKTAELCACACHLGAWYATESSDQVAVMEQFGRDVGMAFQIADDLLDLCGHEQQTGKSLGTDLEKEKLTLPFIHCLRELPAKDAGELKRWLSHPEAQAQGDAVNWLSRTGSLDYARQVAERFARDAAQRIQSLAPSAARDSLHEITQFVVGRCN